HPEARLFEREVSELRIFRDLGVCQPPQHATLGLDWAEVLEPGATERGALREKEIAPPETLPRHRRIGLPVDGEENTRCAVRLRHTLHKHENVAIGIGVNCAGAQCLL